MSLLGKCVALDPGPQQVETVLRLLEPSPEPQEKHLLSVPSPVRPCESGKNGLLQTDPHALVTQSGRTANSRPRTEFTGLARAVTAAKMGECWDVERTLGHR